MKERIKELRIALNLSQQQLALLLDVPPMTISKYERGVTQPNSETLTKIGERLNVNLNWLLLGAGPMRLKQIEK